MKLVMELMQTSDYAHSSSSAGTTKYIGRQSAQTISTDIFQQSKVEQSGRFVIHSLIQLIFEEKDYLSVNPFVVDKNKKCRFFFFPEEVTVQLSYRMLTHTLVMP